MKKLFLYITMALPFTGAAQLDRSIRPTAAEAPKINIGESEVFKTDNGITVILSENHKIPRVSFDLVMGSDPLLEGNKAGLSDFAGEMILSGTSTRSKDQLDSEVDYIGANLNADHRSIYLSCLSKHVDKGLELMSDVSKNANFPESEYERIKTQLASGLLSAKSDAGTMANNAVKKTIFPANHPYSEVMSETTLENITRQDILNYYELFFTPEGSYLVIVGDITKDQAKALVEKYFADWKGGKPYKKEVAPAIKNQGNRVIFVKKPGAVQSVVQIAFPLDMKPGHENQLPLNVTNQILGGGGFGNRMMLNLREDKAYTYGASSRLDIDEYGSYFYAGGNFRNDVTDSAITELLYEIARIGEANVEKDELNLNKSSMAGGFARSLENPQTVARFALNTIKYNLSDDYYQNYLKNLEAVNEEDVLTMSQQYFPAKNCNIIVVGNEEVIERLKVFDADGIIEMLDAYGNPVIESKPADISKDQLIEKYILAVTKSSSMTEAEKKILGVKSVSETTSLSNPQIPFALNMTRVWAAPNKETMKIEGQGMLMQREYFDGTKGGTSNMQTGKKELTPEEISYKKKSTGLFPEMNYKTSGMNYEITGIESLDGKDVYVLKINDGSGDQYVYFDKTTFLKVKTLSIQKIEDESVESTVMLADYKEMEGFMFPTKTTISSGDFTFQGKLESVKLNEKIDAKTFE